MSMDHASPQIAVERSLVLSGSYRCAECPKVFLRAGPRQMFCCPEHRTAWHDRDKIRGRMLVPLRMAAQITRGGSRGDTEIGKRARRDSEHLERRWIAEDRAAGRMNAAEYMRRRYALGFGRT
jgi:hypothetical protein